MNLSTTQTNTLSAVYDAGGTVRMTFRAPGCHVKSLASLRNMGLLVLDDGADVSSSNYLITDAGLDALFGSVAVEAA
jgi:hypothetical protein